MSFKHMEVEVFSAMVGLLANRPRLRTLPPPRSYGNQRLQRQFDGLLMMGIVMPETCWAASVRQSNKFYDWLLHLVGCFYLSDWRCTEPQTLNLLCVLGLQCAGFKTIYCLPLSHLFLLLTVSVNCVAVILQKFKFFWNRYHAEFM